MSTTTYQESDNLPEYDLDRYDFDAEELHGERIVLTDWETGEPYTINPAGTKVWL